jgi:fluoride exporter
VSALLVALGAALGAPLRLLAGHLLDRHTHWGTLLVNLAGSAFLGWLLGHGVDGYPLALLGTGFCGAFTTYSAFAVQSVNQGGRAGLLYAVGTVLGCLLAAWAGYSLG